MSYRFLKLLTLSILLIISCSKKEELVEQLDQDIFLGVGKWKY